MLRTKVPFLNVTYVKSKVFHKKKKKNLLVFGIPAIFPTQKTNWSWQGAMGKKEHVYVQWEGSTKHEPCCFKQQQGLQEQAAQEKTKFKNVLRIQYCTTLVPF